MNEFPTLLRQTMGLLPQSPELRECLALALWNQVVGEALSKKTRPLRLSRSTLIIEVPSQAWQKELHLLRHDIIAKLNEQAGCRLIHNIEFRVDSHFPDPPNPPRIPPAEPFPQPLELPVEAIPDQDLRRSFVAAAFSYLNRNR
ncbi:MAG: DUF721 domain-containing protein [Terriglobia bacterium]